MVLACHLLRNFTYDLVSRELEVRGNVRTHILFLSNSKNA